MRKVKRKLSSISRLGRSKKYLYVYMYISLYRYIRNKINLAKRLQQSDNSRSSNFAICGAFPASAVSVNEGRRSSRSSRRRRRGRTSVCLSERRKRTQQLQLSSISFDVLNNFIDTQHPAHSPTPALSLSLSDFPVL